MRLLLLLSASSYCLSAADFVNDVHPILAQRCWSCHAGPKAQAGLDLTTREGALRVLDAADSKLLARVEGRVGRLMPPSGDKLTAAQISTLRDWISAGAPFVEMNKKPLSTWVAPLEPRSVVPPAGEGQAVDRFLGKPTKGLVSDAGFARRAYFDLWGIAPGLEQLEAFVRSRDPNKREQLIIRLLADQRLYSGHWMSWWNDLMHNDIGVIYHGDRKAITPWLERALRDNMPYDEMVRELVNPIGGEAPEGFLMGVNWRGDVNASQMPHMQAAQNTAQVFLGINLKCASCHDSFINQYKLKQAYGLAAMFSKESRLELVRCDNKTGVFQEPEFLWPEIGQIPSGASASERRYWAAQLFTHEKNGRLARTIVNRYWQKLMGKGLVEPVDDMDAKPTNPDLLDWLALDFVAHGWDLKYLLRSLMSTQQYQRADAVPRRISAEQFTDTLSAVTGEWRMLSLGGSPRAPLVRDWQLKSSYLTRALGRPIRDQVYTTRNEEATTFQGLELANGSTLAALIHRGVMRLMGELPPAPESLFDSLNMRQGEALLDVPVKGLRQIWLLTEDAGTYDPDKALVGWQDLSLESPKGTTSLAAGKLPAKIGSRLVFDVEPGSERLKGKVWIANESKASDINASVRFFVFGAEPDRNQLLKLAGDRPVPAPGRLGNVEQTVARLFLQVLSRDPSAAELAQARKLFPSGQLVREGVEDLLWSLLMHPEFQFLW